MTQPGLSDPVKDGLVQQALAARAHAYAPYSRIRVGAAVLADNGRTYTGCNVENASYGATMCAERVAMFAAVADGARSIRCLAVASNLKGPIAPCGMCRQVAAELGADCVILMSDPQGRYRESTLPALLPDSFRYPAGRR
jgi:cytidine deaminase